MAKDVGAELIIFNVVLLDETNTIDKQEMERHRERLDKFIADKIADVGGSLKIRKMVDAGQPFGAIVDCAEKEGVDLIVMSSHGRSGLSRMLIGSVTDKILRGGPVPCWSCRQRRKTSDPASAPHFGWRLSLTFVSIAKAHSYPSAPAGKCSSLRTISTGSLEWRTTLSVMLPKTQREASGLPWVPHGYEIVRRFCP